MKVLILSDLHANWHALEAVLGECTGLYQEIVCCGDLVGYNAFPGEAVSSTAGSSSIEEPGSERLR